MSVFVGQTLLELIAETGYASIASATTKRIAYRKPNGVEGYWTATVVGTTLTYNLVAGDIDIKGVWYFWAYWVIGGKVGEGTIKSKYFSIP